MNNPEPNQAIFTPTEENRLSPTVHKTVIDGLFYIPHKHFPDKRGFYAELSRVPEIEELTGQKFTIKQMNQSRSNQDVTRGIHAENWNKLVSITNGLSFCAIVDLRPDSPTFSQYVSFLLGVDDQALKGSIFISKGLGNSLCVLKGPVDYIYAVDAIWAERNTDGDKAINLFDKDIDIQWPIEKNKMIFSKRDVESVSLRKMFPEKF